ncbi:hypothetical protein Q5P01_000831 [Channa striata]|uniref:Uncharacterized protein n=1 Tax=Channa striata TaxID=64152 RepID=A0AA88LMX1_CHASR|nr:hypothetical protein Q5P01_000831 [Channa striata]
MEPFQLELFRGVVLGVTKAQFGDSLFRHKHALLSALGLEPLGSESYDHTNPALSHLYRVEKEFSRSQSSFRPPGCRTGTCPRRLGRGSAAADARLQEDGGERAARGLRSVNRSRLDHGLLPHQGGRLGRMAHVEHVRARPKPARGRRSPSEGRRSSFRSRRESPRRSPFGAHREGILVQGLRPRSRRALSPRSDPMLGRPGQRGLAGRPSPSVRVKGRSVLSLPGALRREQLGRRRTAARLRSALLLNRLGEGDARENATSRTTLAHRSRSRAVLLVRRGRASRGERGVRTRGWLVGPRRRAARPFTALLWWVRSRFFLEVELPGRDAARTALGRRRADRGSSSAAKRAGGEQAGPGEKGGAAAAAGGRSRSRPSAESGSRSGWEHPPMAEAGRAKEAGRRKELGEGRALALFGEAAPSRNYTYHEFNNLAGTLTDGPKAFPYAFTVRRRRVNFSDSELLPEPRRPRGPFACAAVGLDQPVLLMEDPWTGTPARWCAGTTVTSGSPEYPREELGSREPLRRAVLQRGVPAREAREQAEPGRGPQVLSGLQREVLQRGGSFDQDLGIRALVSSAVAAIAESLLRLAKVKRSELEGGPGDLANLGDSLGKIAVYQRAAVSKPKLSMRLLWYLPTELCSFEGIEAYRPLLEEIEKTSLGYTLLSYPAEASRCGLCELRGSIARGGRRDLCPRQLRLGEPDRSGPRRSSVDRAPYSFRKCVRLRMWERGSALNRGVRSAFGTASRTSAEDQRSLSVGLSSNPITSGRGVARRSFARIVGKRDRGRLVLPVGTSGRKGGPGSAGGGEL